MMELFENILTILTMILVLIVGLAITGIILKAIYLPIQFGWNLI